MSLKLGGRVAVVSGTSPHHLLVLAGLNSLGVKAWLAPRADLLASSAKCKQSISSGVAISSVFRVMAALNSWRATGNVSSPPDAARRCLAKPDS